MIFRFRAYNALVMSSETKVLLVLLAVALGIQLIYFVRIQSIYPGFGLTTEHYYSEPAVNVLRHGTYGFGESPDIERTTKRPPLYSVVLAGIYGVLGVDERLALVFNNAFLVLTVLVAYLIGRTFSPKIGVLAALLFALDPIGLINANKNQADALYGLLFALFFLATLRSFGSSATLRHQLVTKPVL